MCVKLCILRYCLEEISFLFIFQHNQHTQFSRANNHKNYINCSTATLYEQYFIVSIPVVNQKLFFIYLVLRILLNISQLFNAEFLFCRIFYCELSCIISCFCILVRLYTRNMQVSVSKQVVGIDQFCSIQFQRHI